MRDLISVKMDDSEVLAALGRLERKASNLRPFFVNVGEEMLDFTKHEVFPSQRDPETGSPWAPLKASTLAGKKRNTGLILRDRGHLQDTIRYNASGSGVRWGSDRIYAAIHHFGGKTKAHVIRAKRKKALAWPGARHPTRSVKHPGSKIPARPFLGVGPRGRVRILEIAEDFLGATQ